MYGDPSLREEKTTSAYRREDAGSGQQSAVGQVSRLGGRLQARAAARNNRGGPGYERRPRPAKTKWSDPVLLSPNFSPPVIVPTTAMSKRIRIFTASDVLQHNSESSCWITYKGKVLDVTHFLADHPGGEEFILKYAGRDVEDAMNDAGEHEHSESAFDMLDEFLIGDSVPERAS